MKTEREKQLEIVLKQLLVQHFCSKEFTWVWRDGLSIQSQDPELYAQIVKLLPGILNVM
jgi:hypothetical protein